MIATSTVAINNTAGNDPILSFQDNGTDKWYVGFDNSDGDKFRITPLAGSFSATSSGLTIDVAGNVGIGTTSPTLAFNVIGQCVTGDTRLRRRRRKTTPNLSPNRRATTPNPLPNRQAGLLLKEGSSADEGVYIYDEVAIKDIQPGDEIASLNEKTGKIVYRKVNALMDMGVKEIYKLTTISGKTIRTTGNHPYLVAVNQKALTYRQDFLTRRPVELNHTSWSEAVRVSDDDQNRLVSASSHLRKIYYNVFPKQNNTLLKDVVFGRTADGSMPSSDTHIQYSKVTNLVKQTTTRWTKAMHLEGGQEIAIAGENSQLAWDVIAQINVLPAEQVYDIEVEGTHNFIGNDIVAHNTYLSGNVGIGTATPSHRLTISSTDSASTTLAINNIAGGDSILAFQPASSTAWHLGVDQSDSQKFRITPLAGTFSATSSGLTIDAGGNVGIGTTSPTLAFNVIGQCVTGDTRLRRRRRKSKARNTKWIRQAHHPERIEG